MESEVNFWSNTVNYIHYLIQIKGYPIVIKDFVGFLAKESDIANSIGLFISHDNPYCMKIKTNEHFWEKCQEGNVLLQKACEKKRHWFVGSAYCGITEFVFPVLYKEHAISAICIGGFDMDRKKNARRCEWTVKAAGLPETLCRERENLFHISHPDFNEMAVCSGILADYLALYYAQLLALGIVKGQEVYQADSMRLYVLSNSIAFIRRNYLLDIHTDDIASFCRCSKSYLSHLFKSGMKMSISDYINFVRLTAAKRLLAGTQKTICAIATECGFDDPNYFSFCFHREEGMTPTAFRSSIKKEKETP